MEPTIGEIITFYSYKGGTGRSMALANIACLLAQKNNIGNGVLIIDWDLEAPGLHQFFHGKFRNLNSKIGNLPQTQLGLIDLIYEIKDWLEKNDSQNNTLDDVFRSIDINDYIVKTDIPLLFLMPAGRFDDGLYSTRVNEFDWIDFFNKFPLIFTQFASYLRTKYNYVLIDSRTGYTDTSGICTSIMPEKLVTVFTPNRQSLSGIVELIRRATDYRKQSDDLRPLMIFPLPSRIENAESKLQNEWRFGNPNHGFEGYQTQLESILRDVYGLQACDLTEYFDEYQLQYIPRYSYGEEIAVFSERSEDRLSLARSFEDFTERIVGNENPWERLDDQYTKTALERKAESIENSVLPPAGTYRISLWGPRASGKTTYITMLYGLSIRSDSQWIVKPNDIETTNFVRDNINILQQGGFPQATAPVAEPHIYNFELVDMDEPGVEAKMSYLKTITDFFSSKQSKESHQPKSITVSLADVAGEQFLTEPLGHPLWDRLMTSNGLICLLDPAEAEDHFNITFQSLQYLWLRSKDYPDFLANGGRLPHYVAFCFSKIDRPEFTKFINKPRELILYLERQNNLDIEKLLSQYFLPDRIKYFTISSIGIQAKVDGYLIEHPKDISPINILEPLQWLFDKFNK
ncbi:MAG: AAA family ATPase [Anaerolineales bacterium]|nr:AAA family ATPase [Anaerolineales bacterium]